MGCRTGSRLIYGSQDAAYLRSLEAERIAMVGPDCEYYTLNRGKNVDALWNEPTNDPLWGGSDPLGSSVVANHSWNFTPDIEAGEEPVIFPCIIEYQEQDNRIPSVREEGKVVERDAIVRIARDHWECAWQGTDVEGRVPKDGDVMYVFDEWWDVVRAGKAGYIVDTSVYVGFYIELRSRSQYTPDRKQIESGSLTND